MRPHFIGIAGGSCSGKTTLARVLKERLEEPAAVVSLDSYYKDLAALDPVKREKVNFDHPEAIDRELLTTQLELLARGEVIEVPVYDFSTHTRTGDSKRTSPQSFIIVEGLFTLLWEEVRELFGTKVFLCADETACLSRRLQRDVRERGRTRESVLAQYEETVRPMYREFVLTTMAHADLAIPGSSPSEEAAAAVISRIEGEEGYRR